MRRPAALTPQSPETLKWHAAQDLFMNTEGKDGFPMMRGGSSSRSSSGKIPAERAFSVTGGESRHSTRDYERSCARVLGPRTAVWLEYFRAQATKSLTPWIWWPNGGHVVPQKGACCPFEPVP